MKNCFVTGITSTSYTDAVLDALEMRECTVNEGRRIDRAERSRILTAAKERQRENRWSAPGRSRVVHPKYGTVVVPHDSNLAAMMNAAEVWRCNWTEITDAKVWAAEPGDVAVKMPHVI